MDKKIQELLLLRAKTLEIKTMIVEEITLESFHPWQVYQEIYEISRSHLQQQGVSSSVGDRYLQLRQQLVLEYSLIINNTYSELVQLPSPEELANSQFFESNPDFVAKLRQLGIKKGILDQSHHIYAQTLLELEGNITNRYTQTLLDHPQKEVILALHSQGIAAVTKQWRLFPLIRDVVAGLPPLSPP